MHQMLPVLPQRDPPPDFGRRNLIPRGIHGETRDAPAMPPIRLVLTVARSHQQPVTPHQIVEHSGCAVIPAGDPLGRVPAQHDHDFGFRSEMVARLAGDVHVESAVRNRCREVRMLAHERFEHSTASLERSAVEFLVGQRTRQNPDDLIDLA
jgi:hypothetical protein